MENNLAEIRRQLLAAEVERQGQSNIARLTKKPDSQIRDMIAGRKTFGDRVARQIGPLIRPDLNPDWLLSPSSYTQTPLNQAESAGEHKSIDGLMAQITPILDSAPKTLRNAVLLLAMKYEKDPAEGERIAAAIRALVGAPDDPGT